MAISIAIGIIILALVIGYQISKGKSKRRKFIVWGITTMLGIAPFFSWIVGIAVGINVGDGFAGGAIMVLLFPLIFFIGLILLLIGILKKESKTTVSK